MTIIMAIMRRNEDRFGGVVRQLEGGKTEESRQLVAHLPSHFEQGNAGNYKNKKQIDAGTWW